jgi:hypothetical protein
LAYCVSGGSITAAQFGDNASLALETDPVLPGVGVAEAHSAVGKPHGNAPPVDIEWVACTDAGPATEEERHFQDGSVGAAARSVSAVMSVCASAPKGAERYSAGPTDPLDPHQLAPVYDGGDHVHPNILGLKAMADSVDLSRLG